MITKAQLRYLGKVARTASDSCDTIGEFSTRAACQKNGWLRHEPNPRGANYPMLTYLTDTARAIVHQHAKQQEWKERMREAKLVRGYQGDSYHLDPVERELWGLPPIGFDGNA